MKFNYFDIEYAIKEHDYIIEKSGGLFGIKDKGHLEAVLDFVQHDGYYPTIEDKAAYLFYALNKNHAFSDGNKRASVVLTAYFFEINQLDFIVGRFMREIENIAVDVADNIIDRDLLHEIITSFIYEDDFSIELKMKIIEAKTNHLNNQEQ
ncbi:type II toxin-antitoxin system death-on-curing family toxin [Flavobacterium celericrescens]|uniref:Type II toxin-antitoxin system death-on-curing family toxin n=1 Tax=Flavobacterium celericrescens TaxID=2709780 RepID=A0ABX0IED0_9FLAO|nr:type II toxin-antitoxin system death-on-curing family toxin [Flavobacterium celericrescens]NHM03691.1 type II toxin-antitoxin system death-on-curing family toxin [Flavobacterium celericrescens]